jgi:RNA polymerase sigma-70 factor (ECF subfamily)
MSTAERKSRQPSESSPVLRPDGEESDAVLVDRVLGGDKSCFGILVERYQDVLFNLALRTVGDFDEAQDITQTAFIKAYRSLRSFDPQRRFFSWIYRITLNESLNARKSRRPHETVPETLATSAPDALELLAREERYRELNSAIGSLPELYRRVIELRHRSELTYREIPNSRTARSPTCWISRKRR